MNSQSNFSGALIQSDRPHLQGLVEKYPWCSLARLSLLNEFKKSGDHTAFEKEAKNTALYFSNHNWINWKLHSTLYPEIQPVMNDTEEKMSGDPVAFTNDKAEPVSDAETTEKPVELLFEPLHTSDYFASQGIKLTDEPVSNDKLGSQLKSFTDWLKSMKKVHTDTSAPANEQTDSGIQKMAEHSNEDAGVVTEAMVEVLIKQGKTEKAVEIYRKLSLINPSKIAYFEAKIKYLSADRGL
jgi:hypothetical protein